MIPNFLPNHRALLNTSSCISLKHMAIIIIPASKYNVHNAAFPPLSELSVFLPGT